MKFAMSKLQRRKTGEILKYGEETLKKFADGIQIGYRSEVCEIKSW